MDDVDKFHIEKARKFLPKGYVIVPIEPTKEMCDAGYNAYGSAKEELFEPIYKAMITEAQK